MAPNYYLRTFMKHPFKQKPTLLILAAGIGSRYGSLKQLDPLGPSGETIIDYSVYDAFRAGFGKVVFVIRQSIEKEFMELLLPRFSAFIETGYVLQEIDKVPDGVSINPLRQKPWGTGHAVMMAAGEIHTPFAVINADDFYGAEAFRVMAEFLSGARESNYAMVGYRLDRTLSEFGMVSRGICHIDRENMLADVVEHTRIQRHGSGLVTYIDDDGRLHELNGKSTVSMNFWGFTTDIFLHLDRLFVEFIQTNADTLKGEFYIPTAVNFLLQNGLASVRVLQSEASWFGVTYREDRDIAVHKLAELVARGTYSSPVWDRPAR